eukprot:scaffold49245_cov28-Tisochrysis_lutea.AAC.3
MRGRRSSDAAAESGRGVHAALPVRTHPRGWQSARGSAPHKWTRCHPRHPLGRPTGRTSRQPSEAMAERGEAAGARAAGRGARPQEGRGTAHLRMD